ncbi:Toll/interleukin-1 receptor domain-containing protein [Tanacetum coccineum]
MVTKPYKLGNLQLDKSLLLLINVLITFPVFYDVEPTEVRKQSGAVKEAFTEHEKKEATGKWRDTRKTLADLAGWELKATTNKNIPLIRALMESWWARRPESEMYILSSLEIGTQDVRMIGIKGMGGGGKTTLARGVYDQTSNRFEGKSFVDNQTEIPTRGYEELSGQVVQYAHGLPLTIKVLGSFLCDQKESKWIYAIKRLKTILLKATMEKLELSYNGLEEDYKEEIFLDVACILKGMGKSYAVEVPMNLKDIADCGFVRKWSIY